MANMTLNNAINGTLLVHFELSLKQHGKKSPSVHFSKQRLCPYPRSSKPHVRWQVSIDTLPALSNQPGTLLPATPSRLRCLAQEPKLCTKSGSRVESHTFGEDLTLISAFSLSKAVP